MGKSHEGYYALHRREVNTFLGYVDTLIHSSCLGAAESSSSDPFHALHFPKTRFVFLCPIVVSTLDRGSPSNHDLMVSSVIFYLIKEMLATRADLCLYFCEQGMFLWSTK